MLLLIGVNSKKVSNEAENELPLCNKEHPYSQKEEIEAESK